MAAFPYRDRLRDELVLAIDLHRRTRPKRRIQLALAGTACAAVGATAIILIWSTVDKPAHPAPTPDEKRLEARTTVKRGPATNSNAIVGLTSDPSGGMQSVTLAEAKSALPYHLLVPDDRAANKDNMTGAYMDPGGDSVQMAFPPPDMSSADLRQPFITIYEDPWPGNHVASGQSIDPAAFDKADVAADPDAGKSICQVGDLQGLCVEPRSSSDATQSNPAYVRVVVGDVLVEVSGGDDLELLQRIAGSLTH